MSDTVKETQVECSENPMAMSTSAIHGHNPSLWSWNPRVLPIVTSTNYTCDSLDGIGFGTRHIYTRLSNPTRDCLEKTIAKLEDATNALTFSSGMASVVAVVQLLKPGDHIVCSSIIYGGVSHYFDEFCRKQGFKVSFVDFTNLDGLEEALKSVNDGKLFWLESMANPTLGIVDFKAVCSLIRKLTSEAIICVDNSFLTPCFLKCLNFGVDIVMNSLTKFMNGHGDVTMGCLSTNNKDLFEKLESINCSMGFTPSSFDCYLVCRSLKTLKIRMLEHAKNALEVARFLEKHPAVDKVIYPGLSSHPQHELAKSQLKGFGGMVSAYLKGGRKETESFATKLKVISVCVSLGMAETLLTYPWTFSHYHVSEENKKKINITENMVRISVGLEDSEDLLNDLSQALS